MLICYITQAYHFGPIFRRTYQLFLSFADPFRLIFLFFVPVGRLYLISSALAVCPVYMGYAILAHVGINTLHFWFHLRNQVGSVNSLVMGLTYTVDPTLLTRFSVITDLYIIVEDIALAYFLIQVDFNPKVTIANIIFVINIRTLILVVNEHNYRLLLRYVLRRSNF